MIDIEAARKLAQALEEDLGKLPAGSPEVAVLRAEVQRLKDVLAAPEPAHGWVKDALHDIRTLFEAGAETAKVDAIVAGRYVASIGKMLGL